MAQYEGWEKSLTGLIERAGERVRPWLIHALPVGHRWPNRDGVTLLGDAAHLMPPAGDGANLAMRDAVDLAYALTDPGDWRTAVCAYEVSMSARAEIAARQAMAVLVDGSTEDSIESIEKIMTGAQCQ